MTTLSINQPDIRKAKTAAAAFSAKWQARNGDEKQETASFWLELLRTVYGVERPEDIIRFEERVRLGHTSFIDAHLPQTRVIIEQKSADIDLTAAKKQSDGTELTPYQQGKRYADNLSYDERVRWIVTCNFKEFRVHDLNSKTPAQPVSVIALTELPTFYHRLNFLIDTESVRVEKEKQVSMQAGELISRVYNAMLARYKDPNDAETLKNLNKFCVRLVFCLYAEDAGLFKKDQFLHYLSNSNPREVRERILKLFSALNRPKEARDPYDEELLEFPYVNGGLFADEQMLIPLLDEELVNLILNEASAGFDWNDISPTIFGGLFESTLNPETRRSGGMHYTSIENIHKVIDPLFLDDLRDELNSILSSNKEIATRNRKLAALQDKIAGLTFLDPACGSGNFLTETYISLRRLENEILQCMSNGQREFGGGFSKVKVSIQQFHGIEINDFAVSVAKTAIWIAAAQMWLETQEFSTQEVTDFLPLENYDNIREGNALQLDWLADMPDRKVHYIIGNPPFVGYKLQTEAQKSDLHALTGGAKTVDYVAGWYFKTAALLQQVPAHAAFVSTNSIAQGEQVCCIWNPLLTQYRMEINFAHRTFKWSNEARGQASVHCVIVGFSHKRNARKEKLLFDEKHTRQQVSHINGYLAEAADVFIENRNKPICPCDIMTYGSEPREGGFLIFSPEERAELLAESPDCAPLIRRFVSSDDFINNRLRYCLWVETSAELLLLRHSVIIRERLQQCKEFREKSKQKQAHAAAATPYKFSSPRQPDGDYLLIPIVSSENRPYIPIGFVSGDVIASNACFTVAHASPYTFGVLNSAIHMVWVRNVCGRLKSDFRYSNKVVYNNFPWPTPDAQQKQAIADAAQSVLETRALFPAFSLADLYDPLTMPPELRQAHRKLDTAVEKAYGRRFKDDADRLAYLFELYKKLTENESTRKQP